MKIILKVAMALGLVMANHNGYRSGNSISASNFEARSNNEYAEEPSDEDSSDGEPS